MLPPSLHELDRIRDACYSLVTLRSSASAVAAIVPVPGIDVGADVTILLEMLPTINRKFGLSEEQVDELDPHTKKLILVAATSIGSEIIARTVTKQVVISILKKVSLRLATKQVTKWIPFAGQQGRPSSLTIPSPPAPESRHPHSGTPRSLPRHPFIDT